MRRYMCWLGLLFLCFGVLSACDDDTSERDNSDAADVTDVRDSGEDVADTAEDTEDVVDTADTADTDAEDVADTTDTADTEEDVEPDVAPVCGDGVVQPDAGEECDDGNVTPGDGCDENCRELTGSTRWALRYGGVRFDLAYDVATDSSGNVYIVGMFRDSVEFGSETLTATGGDVFLAKHDASGALLWTKQFGGNGDDVAYHVEVDSNDDVYISGYFYGTLQLSENTTLAAAGKNDAFIAKFNSSGEPLWHKQFGDTEADTVNGFVLDNDNAHAVGSFKGTVDFGAGEVTSTDAAEGAAGDYDMFVVEFEPDGQLAGSTVLGNGAQVTGSDIGVDADGNRYVTGNFSDSVDFGGGALVSAGRSDVFVLKLDASGQHVWSKRFGGSDFDRGSELAVGDEVTVVGTVTDDVDFGGGMLSSNGRRDIFIAQFGLDATHGWSKLFGGADVDQLPSIEPALDGDFLVTGKVFGDADLGDGVVTSGTEADLFVTRFDETGVVIWAHRAVGPDDGLGQGVAVAPDGRVYASGYFDQTTDFGGTSLTTAGSRDIVLWAMEP